MKDRLPSFTLLSWMLERARCLRLEAARMTLLGLVEKKFELSISISIPGILNPADSGL
jgi:hypothetical protein